MAKRNDSVIGFDPLAWMKGGAEPPAEVLSQAPEPVTTPAAPAPVVVGAPAADISSVSLGDMLTIAQVTAMHAELGRHLDARSVALDAGALQRVDAAGLQLLAAFVRAADQRGAQIEWRSPSAALRDGARRLGLAVTLHLV